VGLLDELKVQARSVAAKAAAPDAGTLDRNRRLAHGACRLAHDYWKEFAEQLNVLRTPCPVRYQIDPRFVLDGLVCGDFRVTPQLQVHHGGEPRYDAVVLSWRATNGQSYRVEKELPRDVERLRARLAHAGIPAHETPVHNASTGRIQSTRFEFCAAVTASVRVVPLPDIGKVRLSFTNLDQLERVDADYPAAVLRQRLLDEIGRWIIGQPQRALEYAADIKRYAH
jgi:hypothetical protein